MITLKGGDVRKIKIDIEINFSSFLSKLLRDVAVSTISGILVKLFFILIGVQ